MRIIAFNINNCITHCKVSALTRSSSALTCLSPKMCSISLTNTARELPNAERDYTGNGELATIRRFSSAGISRGFVTERTQRSRCTYRVHGQENKTEPEVGPVVSEKRSDSRSIRESFYYVKYAG